MYTPNYYLRYLDSTTHKYVDASADQRNWTFVDWTLYGYVQMIGVSSVSGWVVSDYSGLTTVAISTGSGFLGGLYGDTSGVSFLTLPESSTSYIYAMASDTTVADGSVIFFSDIFQSTNPDYLLLAVVITDETSIVSIDNTVRNSAGWTLSLEDLLNQHHHNNDPITKIDLATEVQGLLSSDNLGPIDASKIIGTLAVSNIPQLSHTTLDDIGRYTHLELDTLVDALNDSRYIEFGNVLSQVVLQDMLAKSHLYYHSTDPGGYFRFISNLILLVPGITCRQGLPDTPNYAQLLDYDLTTAIIDEVNHVFLTDYAEAVYPPVKYSKTWNENSWGEIVSQDGIDVDDTITLHVEEINRIYESTGTLDICYDTGRVSQFGSLDWVLYDNGVAAPISCRVRVAATKEGLADAVWSSSFTESGEDLLLANRWIEIEITLSTDDTSVTPELDTVTLSYSAIAAGCGRALWPVFNHWEDGVLVDTVIDDNKVELALGGAGTYEASGEFITSVIAIGASTNRWISLTWNILEPSSTDIKLYYRAAATGVGIESVGWSGPYEDGVGGIDLAPVSALGYIQVKCTFATTDTSKTPTFDEMVLTYSENG